MTRSHLRVADLAGRVPAIRGTRSLVLRCNEEGPQTRAFLCPRSGGSRSARYGAPGERSAERGRPGPVALPLCGPCRNGASGTATAPASLLTALEAGRAYVNVHTRRKAAGEIRAQLPAAPLVMSTS